MSEFEIGRMFAKLELRVELLERELDRMKSEQYRNRDTKETMSDEDVIKIREGIKKGILYERKEGKLVPIDFKKGKPISPPDDPDVEIDLADKDQETPKHIETPEPIDAPPPLLVLRKLQKVMSQDTILSKIIKHMYEEKDGCTHIHHKLGTTIGTVGVSLTTLEKMKLITKTTLLPCKAQPKRHTHYRVMYANLYPEMLSLPPLDVPKPTKEIPKKKQKQGGRIYAGSQYAIVLQYISDTGGACTHEILNGCPDLKLNLQRASVLCAYLKGIGRIADVDKKIMCNHSTRLHTKYVATMPVTPESFIELKADEQKMQDEQYQKDLSKRTKELNLDTTDESGLYIYRDVLKSIYSECRGKRLEWVYASQIGAHVDTRRGRDENWKHINTALDRLEQDNYVTHGYKSVAGTKWKLTQRGVRKVLNLDDDTDEDKIEE